MHHTWIFKVQQALLDWFDKNQRILPWRSDPTPYRVWISELMLQQTQVQTVLPYFQRWMKRFPSLSDLTRASLEEVLSHWSGLGYYRRAHMIYRAAQIIQSEYQGSFPQKYSEILALPGIGPYTAGAIASIALGQKRPLVDGNVNRVLSRLKCIRGDLLKNPAKTQIWNLAESLVSELRPGDFNQALMELGALVCRKNNPLCEQCPLSWTCQARINDAIDQCPESKKRIQQPYVLAHALVIVDEQSQGLWLVQRKQGLWAGLWDCPMLEISKTPTLPKTLPLGRKGRDQVLSWIRAQNWNLQINTRPQPVVKHQLTHLKWILIPWKVLFPKKHPNLSGGKWWYPHKEDLPISALTRRLVAPYLHFEREKENYNGIF